MRRREFVTAVGGLATWPLVARAQQPVTNTPVVTLINARRADAAAVLTAEFRKGLSQTGLTEGKDVAVEYHWLDGHYENVPAIISDAVSRHVAVIATPASTPSSLAAKAATSAIPDCVRGGRGSRGNRLGRKPGEARRQRNWNQFFC
jgi:putative ABC transport system substrate-binding protein